MTSTQDIATTIKPTEREYLSVKDLLRGERISSKVRQGVEKIADESRLSHLLTKMRIHAGLTQCDMAKKLQIAQGTVSKIENSNDADLTVGIICKYTAETRQRISLHIGKPLNHVEAVKHHAFAMREHLLELAKLAKQHEDDESIEQEIHAFFGETLLNVLHVVGSCANELPRGKDFEFRMETEEVYQTGACRAEMKAEPVSA